MNKGILIFRQNLKITAIVFMPLHWTMKKYSIQSPCLHNLFNMHKKFIHKNAYIPGFLFAISLEKSLKSFSLLTNNNYVFIFQATRQWFRMFKYQHHKYINRHKLSKLAEASCFSNRHSGYNFQRNLVPSAFSPRTIYN